MKEREREIGRENENKFQNYVNLLIRKAFVAILR